MQKQSVKYGDFVGINNVDKARETQVNELQTAVNVDVNDQGRLVRRKGYRRIYRGECNSLYSDENIILFREGSCLRRLNSDHSSTSLRNDMHTQLPVSYLGLNGLVYYTDGQLTGIVENGANRSWGIEPPISPVISATTGDLIAGDYNITCTYERGDGQESGAPVTSSVSLPNGGGIAITVTASDDSDVDWINIYATPSGGEVAYRVMKVSNETQTLYHRDVMNEYSIPLRTSLLSPPPAGNLISFYNGRMYIADGSVVWYTEPYKYELVSLYRNFLPFEDRVTMFSPVDNGVWVGTSSAVYFLQMEDPTKEVNLVEKAQYGVIFNTAAEVEGQYFSGEQQVPGPSVLFATTRGICLGLSDGMFMNLTDGRYQFPDVERGLAFVDLNTDKNKYLVGLYYGRILFYPQYTAAGTGTTT